MQDVDSLPPQEVRQLNHPNRILCSVPAVAGDTLDALRLHVFFQPPRDRIQRTEEHPVTAAVMPTRQLREEPTGVAILCKMQNALQVDLRLIVICSKISEQSVGLVLDFQFGRLMYICNRPS